MASNSSTRPTFILVATLDDYSEGSVILPTIPLSHPSAHTQPPSVRSSPPLPSSFASSQRFSSIDDPFLYLRMTRHFTQILSTSDIANYLSKNEDKPDPVALPSKWFSLTRYLHFLSSTDGLDVTALRRSLIYAKRFLCRGDFKSAEKWIRVAERRKRETTKRLLSDSWICRVMSGNVCVEDDVGMNHGRIPQEIGLDDKGS